MKGRKLLQLFLVIVLSPWISAFSQDLPVMNGTSNPVLDSLRSKGVIFGETQEKPEIVLTVSQALKYLQQRHQSQYWNNSTDPFRQAMGQLIFNASNPPVDSTISILKRFPYDSLNIPWDKFYIWEPMRVKIPFSTLQRISSPEQTAIKQDTTFGEVISDSLKIEYDRAPATEYAYKTVTLQKDTTIMVVIDTLHEVTSSHSGFPFRYLNYPYQSDSIKVAVGALLKYVEERDSSIVFLQGLITRLHRYG
ncbi:MAG: hypothetical protein IPJ37_12160 [Bacteroidales bacterium]|nr:hypothetical protein [Bacteroidales bacterium]